MQELQLGVGASVGCFVERGLQSGIFPLQYPCFSLLILDRGERFTDLNSSAATAIATDPASLPLWRQPSSTMSDTAYHEQFIQLAKE